MSGLRRRLRGANNLNAHWRAGHMTVKAQAGKELTTRYGHSTDDRGIRLGGRARLLTTQGWRAITDPTQGPPANRRRQPWERAG